MTIRVQLLWVCLAIFGLGDPVLADQEASNFAQVTSGPNGRCYAKSRPDHLFDPDDGPRQQGTTRVYRVASGDDDLILVYPWFSQSMFVWCGPLDDTIIVRLGPWHRGDHPTDQHLAIAFYRNGALVRRYSTLDIAGDSTGGSNRPNVSASASHYTVFRDAPKLVHGQGQDGHVFFDIWTVEAETIDGRRLRFDITSGEIVDF